MYYHGDHVMGKRHFSDSNRRTSIVELEETLANLNSRISMLSIPTRSTLDSCASEYSSGYEDMRSLRSGSDSCFSSIESLESNVSHPPNNVHQTLYQEQTKPNFSGRPELIPRSYSSPDPIPRQTSYNPEGVPVSSSFVNVVVSAQMKDRSLSTQILPQGETRTGWRTWLLKQPRRSLSVSDDGRRNKTRMTVHDEAGGCKVLLVDDMTSVRDVITMMIKRTLSRESVHWTIVEEMPLCRAERIVEDHELVLSIRNSWACPRENKFVFRKDPRKNDPFIRPERLLSKHMKTAKSERKHMSEEAEKAKEILMMDMIVESDRIPDLEGNLYLKEAGHSKWKKAFSILRGSGLHYSIKAKSKEPKHLRCFSHLDDMDVYIMKNLRQEEKPYSRHCLMLKTKTDRMDAGLKELNCICTKDEETMLSWLAGIRIAKYGSTLRENFLKRPGSDSSS